MSSSRDTCDFLAGLDNDIVFNRQPAPLAGTILLVNDALHLRIDQLYPHARSPRRRASIDNRRQVAVTAG
jgi:hypothetical protein